MASVFSKVENRFLRIILIIITIVVIVCGIFIAFISPIAKNYIEKNSVKLIRRQVDIGLLYVNPFTGHVYAHNVVMYEKDNKKKFISIGSLSFNISLLKLLDKKIYFYSVTLNHPWVNIVENKAQFNFDDIFKKDTTQPQKPSSKPVKYYVEDIHLNNGEVLYSEVSIPVHYYVTKLNAECPGIQWDIDSALFKYNFNFLDTAGTVKGAFAMNFKNDNFEMKPVFSHFDLSSIKQYIGEFARNENFVAYLDAGIDAKGNFKDAKNLLATGNLELNDFHFGKPGNDYLSFNTLKISIDSLSPLNRKYFLNTILLDSFYIKYERYDSLDNFSRMFGVGGANVKSAAAANYSQNIIFQIAHFFAQIAQNIVNSEYRIKDFQVSNSKLVYNDFSLAERFSLTGNPVIITAKNIDTKTNRMYVNLKLKVNPYGDITINFDVNPVDFGDFNLVYNIGDFPIPLFNPYTVTYTSYPFDNGTLNFDGSWHVVNKHINSINHIVVTNPTLAMRVKDDDAKKIPMHVIMFFIRDVDRKIDVQVPITGNLNDPSYHVWGAILHVLENIVIKPPAFPFTTVKLAQTKDQQDYTSMEWQLNQKTLTGRQKGQLKKISRYMFFHPNAEVTIAPHNFETEEKEMILWFEAKKLYYLHQHHININELTKNDSISIAQNSVKDTGFIHYIESKTRLDSLDFTLQGRCRKVIGKDKVNALYNTLLAGREQQVKDFFNDKSTLNRVKFENGINEIPASGFSHYLFYYKGEQPPVLTEK